MSGGSGEAPNPFGRPAHEVGPAHLGANPGTDRAPNRAPNSEGPSGAPPPQGPAYQPAPVPPPWAGEPGWQTPPGQVGPVGPNPPPQAWQPREYPQLMRGPGYRWWQGLVTILLAVIGFFLPQLVLGAVLFGGLFAQGAFDDMISSGQAPTTEELTRRLMASPWFLLGNNLALAALIPLSMFAVWVGFRWRPAWATSVAARVRWKFLFASAAITAAIYGVYAAIEAVVNGTPPLTGGKDVVLLLVIVALTTPLQAAGEEYLFRGALTQAIGSWFARPLVAFLSSATATAILFAVVHSLSGFEQNIWLWLTRFGIGFVTSLLTWRTGGLEAGIALHAVNNYFGLVPAILTGQLAEALSNPHVPVLAAVLQLLSVCLVAACLLVLAKRMGVQRVHDPAAQPGGTLPATNCWPTAG